MTRAMPSVTGVRFDRELGEFQLRCADCARRGGQAYWPLTLDFWSPKHGMSRCKACWDARRAARLREALRNDPERRAAKNAANREHRKVMWPFWEAARRERLASDPEKLERRREKAREATRRYRERLNQTRLDGAIGAPAGAVNGGASRQTVPAGDLAA